MNHLTTNLTGDPVLAGMADTTAKVHAEFRSISATEERGINDKHSHA
jgi:hypothetical protein